MLLLLFEIGNGRYALTTGQVAEILPLVKTKKIPMAPPYVAGLMNYRGEPIPVIDLSQLLVGKPCVPRFSTRIILTRYPYGADEQWKNLGLIAEQVTETVKTGLVTIPSSGVLMDETLYQDGIESDTEGMVQWFDLKRMLPTREIEILFQG